MRIPLTQGKEAVVDNEAAEWLNQHSWCYDKSNGYALRAFYKGTWGKGKYVKVYMHRAILEHTGINLRNLKTDHRNRNKLDNRKANLRTATNSQNGQNRTKQKGASSQYLGVHWYRAYGKWMAKTTNANGESVFLGYFENEIEAAKARDRSVALHHGGFASLNFPGDICRGK